MISARPPEADAPAAPLASAQTDAANPLRRAAPTALVDALAGRFGELTTLLYDTRVPASRLDAEVLPHLADEIRFTDPWQFGQGKAAYQLGMKGFHALFRFRLEITRVSVQLDARGEGGRALVDGVMHLELIPGRYTYPLRTLVTYDFELLEPTSPEAPPHPLITAHEEMWSFGDMIAALPLVGRGYQGWFRPAFARAFLALSRVAIARQARKQR